MCRIQWLWPRYINYIFTMDLSLARYHRRNKFWHMGVFLTLGWPWPLTYMLLAGGILTEFHSQFYLFIYSMMEQLISRYDPFRQEVIVESRGHCILHLPWWIKHKRQSVITLIITSFYLPMQVHDGDSWKM